MGGAESSGFYFLRTLLEPHLMSNRKHGKENDHQNNFMHVEINVRNRAPQPKAGQDHGTYPPDSSDDVVKNKAAVIHATDARNDGRKSADDRNKARQHNGF